MPLAPYQNCMVVIFECNMNVKVNMLSVSHRGIYDDTTLVVGTYFGIMQDQLYFILYPQQ